MESSFNNFLSGGKQDDVPAPVEFLHGRLMDLFHEWRIAKSDTTEVLINGSELSKLIAKAKNETIKKYNL